MVTKVEKLFFGWKSMETTPNRNSTGLVLKMVNLDLIFMGAENKVQQNHKKCKEQKENTHTHICFRYIHYHYHQINLFQQKRNKQ